MIEKDKQNPPSFVLSHLLTFQVYLYLLQHLRHGNYTLVLQTLNRHFSIKNSNALSSNKYVDEGDHDDMEDMLDDSYEPLSTSEQQVRRCG